MTKVCLELGWQGKQQPFELLPIVVQISDKLYFREIPEGLVLEVPIEHPTNPLFEELQYSVYCNIRNINVTLLTYHCHFLMIYFKS